MEIRKKLTYQFAAIVAVILLIASMAIYVSFSKSRKEEFYGRLESKAKLVAQMLIDIEGIDTEMLRRIEKNNPLSLPNEKIIIYDYQNRVIYSSDEDQSIDIPIDYINKVRLNNQIRFTQKPYELLGEFYTGEYDRIVVFAGAVDLYGFSKLNRLRLILLIVFVSSMIIVYFSGILFASRALKPVAEIITQADGINIANLNERIDEGNGIDELARLAKTFNRLLGRIEAAFKVQKNFIANASHELRTPLTVITGQLEVALLSERNKEEYLNTINSVLCDIRNLNHLSNRLLLLAQASSELPNTTFSPIRIDDIIWSARSEILKRKENYSINILMNDKISDESMLMVYGNDLLLKTAVLNLMDNACKYSPDNTSLVFIETINQQIQLVFQDNGIGIPPDELSLIFSPFYRAKNSMEIKGHGIGLSLVDRIIIQHKGSIHVNSKIGTGSEFTLRLPLLS